MPQHCNFLNRMFLFREYLLLPRLKQMFQLFPSNNINVFFGHGGTPVILPLPAKLGSYSCKNNFCYYLYLMIVTKFDKEKRIRETMIY